jgi:hypothetical protein
MQKNTWFIIIFGFLLPNNFFLQNRIEFVKIRRPELQKYNDYSTLTGKKLDAETPEDKLVNYKHMHLAVTVLATTHPVETNKVTLHFNDTVKHGFQTKHGQFLVITEPPMILTDNMLDVRMYERVFDCQGFKKNNQKSLRGVIDKGA